MGYTHYWNIKINNSYDSNKMRDNFSKVAKDVNKALTMLPKSNPTAGGYCEEYPVKISGGCHGYPRPIVNESEIWFNGDEAQGMDHESFSIGVDDFYDGLYEGKFSFCKTARKPYDLLVCFTLISLAHHFPKNVFTFSSDGGTDDWAPAFDFYTQVTGKKVKKSTPEFVV